MLHFFDFTFISGIFFDINLLDLTILAGTGLFQSLWLIMSTKTGLCLESRSHHLNYMCFSSEKKQQKWTTNTFSGNYWVSQILHVCPIRLFWGGLGGKCRSCKKPWVYHRGPLELSAPKADETKLTEIGPKDAVICKQFCEEKPNKLGQHWKWQV